MKISISKIKPTTKPVREYETRFLSIGFKSRYNTHTKTISTIMKLPCGDTTYDESTCDIDVFSCVYSSENARVIVYSDSPKIWCEEISPTEYFVFSEVTLQN